MLFRTFLVKLAVLVSTFAPWTALASPIGAELTTDSQVAENPQPAELQQAIEAFRRGEFAAAQSWLTKARKKQPQLPPPPVMLATMHFSEEQPAAGRSALEQAAIEFPDDPEPALIFGDLALRERRLSDAQAQYLRSQQLADSFAGDETRKQQLQLRALLGLANVAEGRGEFSAADKLFSQVIAIDPKHGNAHFRLGNVLFALDRPEEALAEFNIARELSDAAPNPNLALAQLCQQAGKLDAAKEWFERAIAEAPADAEPKIALARWQLEVRGDVSSAESLARDSAKLAPDSIDAPLILGVVSMVRGNPAQAEAYFAAVLKKSPGHFLASNQMAVALAEQSNDDRRQQAWELAHVLAESNPQNAEAAATLGWVALQLGDLDEAEKQLRRAMTAGSVSRDTTYYYARMLNKRGELAQAKTFLQQALDGKGLFTHLQEAEAWKKQLRSGRVAQQ